jgi:hypothetical protein
MKSTTARSLAAASVFLLAAFAAPAQETAEPARIEVSPTELKLKPGETAQLSAKVFDAQGNAIESAAILFISRDRRAVSVSTDGEVSANDPGEYVIVAMAPRPGGDAAATGGDARRGRRGGGRGGRGGRGRGGEPASFVQIEIPIIVVSPAITGVAIGRLPSTLYAGTVFNVQSVATDETGEARPEVSIGFATSDPAIAQVGSFGQLSLLAPGDAKIVATAEGAVTEFPIRVRPNPVRAFDLNASAEKARTGDVVRFHALAKDASGRAVPDLPVHYAVFGTTAPNVIAAGATALVRPDGRFVAERSGVYTVMASSGTHSAMKSIEIAPREVRRRIEILGQGRVSERATTDLWIWTAPDGRDYGVTGTKETGNFAYFWDVTDPSNIEKVAEIAIDARTVNDVKVSEDGRIAIVSREGASNRRNGIILYDVSNPREGIAKIAEFDDELTGGVHNVYIYQGHVYALSAGQRYDIINIENPFEPFRVGRFELDAQRRSGIHDVWVVDGIAYSSNWANGVVAVDVGGGGMGGSPSNPIKIAQYAYPNGRNHAAFPYRSKSTGKFYVFAGDEAFPERFPTVGRGTPRTASGWIHVIEWDDWDRPNEVARYEVPEAGTHNFWIEDDVLYVAYYNGGLRVVDVSGELLGNLYDQGREIAYWLPQDPEGRLANSPNTWGAQPFKGSIFISDKDSGLWALKLGERVTERTTLLEDR